MNKPKVVYLDLDDGLAAGTAALGRAPEVRDFGLLESALARPKATVFGEDAYPDLHGKAAALVESLVKNHALIDGNKRLGLVAVRLFYGLNEYEFRGTDDEKFSLVMDIAAGHLGGVEEIAARLESLVTSAGSR